MKTEITRMSWEDVVFESRNKEYGAYSIRKAYDYTVSKATFISICVAVTLFVLMQLASKLPQPIITKKPTDGGLILQPPPNFPIDLAKPKPQPPMRTEQVVNRDLIATVVTHDTDPVVVEPETTSTGTDTGVQGISTGSEGTGTAVAVEVEPAIVKKPEFFDHPEVNAEYEGGLAALYRFIGRNVKYPHAAKSLGQEGTVFVRFVIGLDGQVENIEVIKGVTAVLDQEAMRVVGLLKKWKPGMQNNAPVKVRMVLPIKFQLEQ